MKATSFRATMGVIVTLIVGGSVFGFYNVQSWLLEYSDKVGAVIPQSNEASSIVQLTNKMQSDITKYTPTTNKANAMITADQDSVIQKLNNLASSTGVSITNSSFRVADAAEGAGLIGVKLNLATISINNPVNYTTLIRFIKAVEGSLPKMQISQINISRVAESSNVNVSSIVIEYYTAQ